MKQIEYELNHPYNAGSEREPIWIENVLRKILPYSEENEAIARMEAYNGIYTITDDGEERDQLTRDERIAELEEALQMLLTGVTE